MFQNTIQIRRQAGFTLMELMVVMGILAIITSMAAPNMTTLIKNNRLQTMNADFSALIKYARSEAKNKGQAVLLSTIDNSNNWQDNTVVVYVDSDASDNYSTADLELRRLDISDNFTVTAVDSVPASISGITFLSSGFTSNGAYTFTLCDDRAGNSGYQYSVFASGLSFSGDLICP